MYRQFHASKFKITIQHTRMKREEIQEYKKKSGGRNKIINFIQLSLVRSTNENNPSLTITDIASWLRQLFQN